MNVSDILLFLQERLFVTLPMQYYVLPTCKCICSCSYIESTGPLIGYIAQHMTLMVGIAFLQTIG